MKYTSLQWRNGQPYSAEFDDIYYSEAGAREESEYVFLQNNDLPQRWKNRSQFVISETGFGAGLNFILTMQAWEKHADVSACLYYVSFEKHPVAPDDLKRIANNWPDLQSYFDELIVNYPPAIKGHHSRVFSKGRVRLLLVFMDACEALQDMGLEADAWYLDGFTPAKNPELWNENIFDLIAKNSRPGATLSTYTAAGSVKRNLESSGFEVSRVKGHGNKREMITAVLRKQVKRNHRLPWHVLPQPPQHKKTAVVLGAGMAGLSVAWSLIQRGWKVTVVDKHEAVAREASGNPVGLLLPRLSIDNVSDAIFYSNAFLYSINQFNQLQKQSDEKFWFDNGIYSLYTSNRAKKIIKRHEYPNDFIALVTGPDVPDYFEPGEDDIVYFPKAGCVFPQVLCESIVKACKGDLTLMTAEAGNLTWRDGHWNLDDNAGKHIISSPVVILANGSAVRELDVVSWLPVLSSRGQITTFKPNTKSRSITHACGLGGYITPEFEGLQYVGASYSLEEVTHAPLEKDNINNLERLNKHMPGIFSRADITGARVAFRAVTNDRTPVVGPVPDKLAFESQYGDLHHGKQHSQYRPGKYLPGLYVSVAHGSRGLTSCFLSAEIIASMLERSPLPVANNVINYLSAARFLVRNLKRGPIIE